MNLISIKHEGVEIYVDNATGETYTTIAGYSRMSGLTRQAVQKRLQGCNSEQLKTAEVYTEGGLQGCNLITEDLMSEWLPLDNPELTTKLIKLGVRKFLQTLAGFMFQPVNESTQPKLTPEEEAAKAIKNIDELLMTRQPRIAQVLMDSLINRTIALPPAEGGKRLRGVVEVAEEMGYVVNMSQRGTLGKFVKRSLGVEPVREERLVNGTMRPCNLYEDSDELRSIIVRFFES